MTVITDKTEDNPDGISTDWSAGILLSTGEILMNRGGVDISISTGASAPSGDFANDDGVLLKPGDSVALGTGVTFRHRRLQSSTSGRVAILTRTPTST